MTMVMSDPRTFTASRLKAELLGVLDDVERSGTPVTVTKHGRAVARIVPMSSPTDMTGSVRFLDDDDALLEPVDESWDAAV